MSLLPNVIAFTLLIFFFYSWLPPKLGTKNFPVRKPLTVVKVWCVFVSLREMAQLVWQDTGKQSGKVLKIKACWSTWWLVWIVVVILLIITVPCSLRLYRLQWKYFSQYFILFLLSIFLWGWIKHWFVFIFWNLCLIPEEVEFLVIGQVKQA